MCTLRHDCFANLSNQYTSTRALEGAVYKSIVKYYINITWSNIKSSSWEKKCSFRKKYIVSYSEQSLSDSSILGFLVARIRSDSPPFLLFFPFLAVGVGSSSTATVAVAELVGLFSGWNSLLFECKASSPHWKNVHGTLGPSTGQVKNGLPEFFSLRDSFKEQMSRCLHLGKS